LPAKFYFFKTETQSFLKQFCFSKQKLSSKPAFDQLRVREQELHCYVIHSFCTKTRQAESLIDMCSCTTSRITWFHASTVACTEAHRRVLDVLCVSLLKKICAKNKQFLAQQDFTQGRLIFARQHSGDPASEICHSQL